MMKGVNFGPPCGYEAFKKHIGIRIFYLEILLPIRNLNDARIRTLDSWMGIVRVTTELCCPLLSILLLSSS